MCASKVFSTWSSWLSLDSSSAFANSASFCGNLSSKPQASPLTLCFSRTGPARRGWTTAPSGEEEGDALRCVAQDILWQLCPSTPALKPAKSKPRVTPAYCGKTKVFLTNPTLELLEARRTGVLSEKASCIQCCWRRFKRREQAKQRRSATVIQSAVRSWLARGRFQRLRKAATVIKIAWRKWKAKMDVLAAEELDDTEGKSLSSFPGATVASSQTPSELEKLQPRSAIIQFWPLGLVLVSAPATMGSFQRALTLLTCLRVLQKNDVYEPGTKPLAHGITSVRALPQGSVKFRCRKSPLLYAEMRPHSHGCTVTGFNQILLDHHERLSA